MKFRIIKGYNKAYNWIEAGPVSFIGYLNDDHILFPDKEFISGYFKGCREIEEYKVKITQLNGVFSIIIRDENRLIACSDSTRFFPLFYAEFKEELVIGDDIEKIKTHTGYDKVNIHAKLEYLASAHTGNNRTLYDKIFQLRPAEMMEVKDVKISSGYYLRFSQLAGEILTSDHEELKLQAEKVIDHSFERLLHKTGDKRIALPLSGGYDSRLIACQLKKNGIRNVVCFTYGRHTHEVEISKRVAETLGYEWHFVEYTPELIKDFHKTETFGEYYRYASRGTSMFYLQEYPALLRLTGKKIIDEDCIAFPGHSGDLLRGALLVKTYPTEAKLRELPGIALDRKYNQCKLTREQKKELKNALSIHFKELGSDQSLSPYSVLEDWEMKERTAKYIFNSSHVFTFFGIRPVFPLWDRDLTEFFRRLPLTERKFEKLYKEVTISKYFNPSDVWFEDEKHAGATAFIKDHIKKSIRPFLPMAVKEKLLIKNDWAFYGPMTEYLLGELNENGIYPETNGSSHLYRILNWYLMKTGL